MPYRGFPSKTVVLLAASGISSSYGPGIRGALSMIDTKGLFIKNYICTQPLDFVNSIPSEETKELIIANLTAVLEKYLAKKYGSC